MPILPDTRVKKKNGLLRYRVIVNYTDANGKHVKVERIVWGKAEAEAMERQLEDEYKDKRISIPSKMAVDELFAKYEQYHATETRRTSHEAALNSLRLRVLPYFKGKRIDRLTQSAFAEWKIALDNNELDLSLRTKQNAYKAFSAMLNYAVKMEFIPRNNLSVVGNFKDSTALDKPPEKLHYYTAEQFQKFISVAKSDCSTVIDWGYFVFFSLAFFTGARKGEINALKWSDIDGNILHIRRSITQKLKVGDVETSPKNRSSIRDLQLPTPLMLVLNDHKKRQQEAAPNQFSEDYRICGGEIPLRDTSIDKRNRKYADMAGLPHIKIHDYRHTFATMALENGMDIKSLSAMLGHISSETTIDIYSHVTDTMRQQAAVKIDRRIGGTEAEISRAKVRSRVDTTPPDFKPYKPKCRKSGTGCVTMINDHLYEGRYTPTNVYGKRESHNIYAKTREECEEKLAAMIEQVKADIKAEKNRLKSIEEP